MITGINYNLTRSIFSFVNKQGKRINYVPSRGYDKVYAFKVIDDEIICVLLPSDKQSNELRRRNVVKIDDSGNQIWRVSDSAIWSGSPSKTRFGRFSGSELGIKNWGKGRERSSFGGFEIDGKTGRLALVSSGDFVSYVDIDTGQLEFWYLEWPTPE
ncbi:hypothetical protein CO045_01240 [Candidatus Peregrinibacteria bacterium CG_4_9_14_0_2_um_filter_41_14]|nr:MAG: hypothetical protein COY06_01975 [Candidatus Peregrinibacteria bacterium CG_4_10_14_0_2_um_filter_41_8]PJC38250.1 MAG: hypothetical protein CO045_01240 [Candidatus Peregrinibacteria bacterium CG_4_9_14_0_2_um_filter_41_14]